jgi:hypothetical protein
MGFRDELKKRADAAQQGAERIAKDLRKVAETAAESTFRKAEEAAGAIRDVLESRQRLLTPIEIDLAKKVFGDSLPYGAIYLSDALGLQRRAYTIPHPAKIGSYLINIGPDGFADASTAANDDTLIHELSHVWQGVHRAHPLDYVFDSIHNQARLGSDAYDYVAGADWNSYGAEQQAKIVADWYQLGMSEADSRFRYIRDNIRAATS